MTDDGSNGRGDATSGYVLFHDGVRVQSGNLPEIHHHYAEALWTPPFQVPEPRRSFNPRDEAIAKLDALSEETGVVVVRGGAGVGKSELVREWARLRRSRFPGGQLYADLGQRPGGFPAAPESVLRVMLIALGASKTVLSRDLPELRSEFLTRTIDKGVLLVLDDAFSAAQARTLFLSDPRGLVVVTSRWELSGLVLDGAQWLVVGPHPPDKARGMVEEW